MSSEEQTDSKNIEDSENTEIDDTKTISSIKVRVVGFFLLVTVVGMACTHIFTTNLNQGYYTDNSTNSIVGTSLMMGGFFVVMGFGLIFAYYG